MRSLPCVAAILFLAGILLSCKKKDDTPQSITEVVANDPRFTLLNATIAKAGLGTTLSQGTLTIFAPTDDAFKAAGIDAAALSAASSATLAAILQNHVLSTKLLSSDLPASAFNTELTTTGGGKLYASKLKGWSVNGARVTQADVLAPNGVVHVVDKVLLPPTGTLTQVASANPDLSLLVVAVNRIALKYPTVANGLNGPGPLTVFAPTNKAFQDAGLGTAAAINALNEDDLVKILTYHILAERRFSPTFGDGDGYKTFQGSTIRVAVTGTNVSVKGTGNTTPASLTQPDVVATNAVLHVVDKVLLP